jgi:hypothetical protein
MLRLWDVSTGKPLGEPFRGHNGGVLSVAFSPDGKTLASGSWDKTLHLWDASTGKPLGELLPRHEGPVQSVAFSPDGKTLASESGDQTLRLWSGVPMRERVPLYRARMAEVERVRALLADRISGVGEAIESVRAFSEEVRADPRIAGEVRTAALIVVGEVDTSKQAVRASKEDARREWLKPLEGAVAQQNWALALQLVATARADDLASLDASFLNLIAWRGLTELPADSPGRDLKQLLDCAERAVVLSDRREGFILDTLARAHWELGDKVKAIEVQREAVQVSASTLEQALRAELEETLKQYESLPAGAALPTP